MKRERTTIICSVIFIVIAGIWYSAKGSFPKVQEQGLSYEVPAVTEDAGTIICTDSQPPEQKVIYCYICGAVKNPGVYECLEGARLNQLIELAGGFTKQAAGTSLNLARIVSDAERIYVPTCEEIKEEQGGMADIALNEDGSDRVQTGTEDKVNINTADIDRLTSLPGIGQAKAKSICSYREEHGAFQSIEELKNVEGIKDGVYNKVKDLISIQ